MDVLPQETATALDKSPTRSSADSMGQTARFKAAIATAFIEQREDLYQRTGNTIHLWHVYVLARKTGMPIPSWVLDYFDQVAGALTAPQGPTSPQALVHALGLATKGGPSKARQAKTAARDLDIVGRIFALQNFAKAFPDRAIGLANNLGILLRVAEEFGLSLDRVQAIYSDLLRSDPSSPPAPRA